jgi:hypothetical protein
MTTGSWFHAKDGVHFRRLEDGSVEMGIGPDFNSVASLTVLDPSSWASVVAHVSARGEDAAMHAAALAYHEAP